MNPGLTVFAGPWPDDTDAPFWAAIERGELVLQQCQDCARVAHPPTLNCVHCRSPRRRWVPAPPVGTLFTFTVARTAAHESAKPAVPYAIVVVAFEALEDVRLIGNVEGVAIEGLTIGMPLAWRIHRPEGRARWIFRPADVSVGPSIAPVAGTRGAGPA